MQVPEKTAKILIVDDEPHIITALEFLMQQQGFEIAKAYNGEEALGILDSFHPDVVVLDVMMPGMDGFELAKMIRTKPQFEDSRIIFLTAKGTDEDKEKGYVNGGDVYIPKPFDNNHLITTINEVIAYG